MRTAEHDSAGAKPKTVVAAVLLCGIDIGSTVLRSLIASFGEDGPATMAFGAVIGAAMGLLLVKIRAGRNWARIVYLMLTIVGLLGLPLMALPGVSESFSFLDAVEFAIGLAIVVLLFTPSANEWFRAMKTGIHRK